VRVSLQCLRRGRFFLLLATHCRYELFRAERAVMRDARWRAITLAGHAVSYQCGHAHMRVEWRNYRMLQEHFRRLALRRRPEELAWELQARPFESYAPVPRQLLGLLRLVNRARKTAVLDPVETGYLRRRRRIRKPFTEGNSAADGWLEAYLARFAAWRPAASDAGRGRGVAAKKHYPNPPGLC
jgi:hypothetical protein